MGRAFYEISITWIGNKLFVFSSCLTINIASSLSFKVQFLIVSFFTND